MLLITIPANSFSETNTDDLKSKLKSNDQSNISPLREPTVIAIDLCIFYLFPLCYSSLPLLRHTVL